MSTNLKYFLGKRRSDLKTYCVKNSFETYEKLIAHLREIGVEFPTLEEYDSVCLEVWLDPNSHTIMFQFDRVTVGFDVDEFLYFCDKIEEARQIMIANPDYVVGKSVVNGVETEVLMPKPEPDDYT